MSITRTPIVDDDGTGTTGTVLDNAWKQEIYDQIDAADAASIVSAQAVASRTETGTGNITSLTLPTGSGLLTVYMNNASLATIQGIASGLSGQRLRLVSKGAGQVDLSHQDAAATAALRLINFATSAKSSLAAGNGVAEFEYDTSSSRWRMVAHEQGAWIQPGNPTLSGNGSMTWTIGTVNTWRYVLRGRTLTFAFDISGTIGGVVNTQLTATYPNGFSGGGPSYIVYDFNTGTAAIAQSQASAVVVFFKDLTAGGNFVAGTGRVIGTMTCDVT